MKPLIQIKTTGERIPLDGQTATLEQLQAYVQTGTPDSLIECVNLVPEKIDMIVHEEGLNYDLPVNIMASLMAQRHIVGDVVIVELEKSDFE